MDWFQLFKKKPKQQSIIPLTHKQIQRIEDKKRWEGWNYNVGHDEFIQDKYNPDIIAFMSSVSKVKEWGVVMVYDPSVNECVWSPGRCYNIQNGTYTIQQSNEINVCSNNS